MKCDDCGKEIEGGGWHCFDVMRGIKVPVNTLCKSCFDNANRKIDEMIKNLADGKRKRRHTGI